MKIRSPEKKNKEKNASGDLEFFSFCLSAAVFLFPFGPRERKKKIIFLIFYKRKNERPPTAVFPFVKINFVKTRAKDLRLSLHKIPLEIGT